MTISQKSHRQHFFASGLHLAGACLAYAIGCLCLLAQPAWSAPVTHVVTTVNGLQVDRYTWRDSRNRPRSVSLKREGNGNPGHGGYAVQMTYQFQSAGIWRNVTVNAAPGFDGGFGYFVSHERYRDFTDGDNDTIAHKVFGRDDSPLGLGFAVTSTRLPLANPDAAAHRFTLRYPRYGTVNPIPKDANGQDVQRTPTAPEQLKLYSLPITIEWIFLSGTDYPRIRTTVDLSGIPGPDRVNFDLRGPYGVMRFDNGADRVIDRVIWGDRYHFSSTGQPLTRNSAWSWRGANAGARYHALIAGGYEMGLLEPRTFASSKLVDGWSSARNRTSATYNNGQGCPFQGQIIPCDWEWPYQSAQYSLPYDNRNAPTDFKKIAWGTAAYWGTGPSLPAVWDTNSTSKSFIGFPASKEIVYDICVVLGRTIQGGLTRAVAAGPNYNCAVAVLP